VGSPNSWQPPPPGEPVDPDAWMSGGVLDHDGNAGCHRDGAPSEHVVWKTRMGPMGPVAPIVPPGAYSVRVDARSLCGAPDATWEVAVYRTNGELVGAAR